LKTTVKTLLTGFALGLFFCSHAQLPNTASAQDFKKVIRDYPNQFRHLQGELLQEKNQSTDYDLNFPFGSVEKAVITRYSSKGKPVVACEALVVTTENFADAARKYHSIYATFNNMAVKMDNGVTFYLKGTYEAPVEEVRFNSSMLVFEKPEPYVSKMKVEVSMQYEFMEWTVRVKIYDRDREDAEQGDQIDEEELDD